MAANYLHDEEEDSSQYLVTRDNCLENEGYILNPQTLPCQHVFRVGQRRNPAKHFCVHKDCLQEHDADIDDLPSALGDLKICCDTCGLMNGENFMTASVFCVQCDMRYCDDHHKLACFSKIRSQVNKHGLMSIKEYMQSSFAHEVHYCDKHKQEVYSLGCPDCSQMFCAECVNSVGDCQDDSANKLKLISLKKLSEFIKSSVEPLKTKVEDKYAKISAVVNELTITLSEWELETDEGVRLLRRTRDEQLEEIRVSYTKLEEDYIRIRKSSKEKITDYLSEKATVKQSEYLTQLQKLRTEIAYRHPVDLVKEREEIQRKVEKLMSDEFPKLVLQNQVKAVRKDEEKREMEIELLSTGDVIIGDHVTPPTGLQLVRQVTVGGWCLTVCRYKGYTYVGLDGPGGVDRIDDQGNVTSKFIKSASGVVSVRAHNDRLYTLLCSTLRSPRKMCVYDLSGKLITSWVYERDIGYSLISIINDQLAVVCSPCQQQLIIHTLNGDFVRSIPCPLITYNRFRNNTAMCEAGDDSVIITDEPSSKVFRVKLTSGEIEWISTYVQKPLGVVCYGGEYVLVASKGRQTKVEILNINDGELVGELTDQTVSDEDTLEYDLYVERDTLIVPRCFEESVLYYKLQTKSLPLEY